ncbi:MAG: class I tRNA ligase family protein [Rhizomicrobium sp.]
MCSRWSSRSNPNGRRRDHADLYLEGSDQHRGWFQSSLLESCATRGRAPYDEVLTAGFVLDREGDKMSKSVGNVILPQAIAEKNGADIFRLWVASSDFTQDLRMGSDVIQANADAYRRLRNTIRFMLANLAGFDEAERIAPAEMPELERYILAKLAELDGLVREGYESYDFNRVYNTVFSFCTNELSSFYFDIRKDSLYCDSKRAVRRRSARTVTDEVFRRVVTWLAPLLCFTMEEAWLHRFPGEHESVHLQVFPRDAGRLAQRRADREMEPHPRPAPRRHRRAGAQAPRQGDRRQPGGTPGALHHRSGGCRAVRRPRSRRDRDHLGCQGFGPCAAGRCLPACRRCGRGGRIPPCRGRQMRPLLDDPARGRHSPEPSRPLQTAAARPSMPLESFPPPLLRGRWHGVAKRSRDGGGPLRLASPGTSPATAGEENGAGAPCG